MTRLEKLLRIMRAPPPERSPQAPLPTALPCLDRILGGGLPQGQLLSVHGAVGVGKTTLGLQLCRAAQAAGPVAFMDPDCGLSPGLARSLGVSMRELLYSAPPLWQVPPLLEGLVTLGGLSLVVVDIAEGWPSPGSLRPLRRHAAASGTTVLFLTQHRAALASIAFASHRRLMLRHSGALRAGHRVWVEDLESGAGAALQLRHGRGFSG